MTSKTPAAAAGALTKEERDMAIRIGTRVAESMRHGNALKDAVIAQVRASGIDPWDTRFPEFGAVIISTALEKAREAPNRPKKGRPHTEGWGNFAANGSPQGEAVPEDEDSGEGP